MSTVNIWIAKRSHTDIIGKGGAVIKKLSSDHNVSIKIPAREDPTSMVQILGAAADAQKAIKSIEGIIGQTVSLEPFVTLQFDIPSNVHGLLIGKGGATLKDIESTSHAHVTIPKRDEPNGHVTVEGTKDATNKAKEMISKIIGSPVKVVGASVEQITVGLEKLDLNKPVADALFFPDASGKNHEKFLRYLGSAKNTLDICVFTITDDRVARVIEDSHRSGVKVRLISDDECLTQIGSDIQSLAKVGIPTKSDNSKAHMHHKFAVLDGTLLINGSFNWTRQASLENRENMMISNDKVFVDQFVAAFEGMWTDNVNFKDVK